MSHAGFVVVILCLVFSTVAPGCGGEDGDAPASSAMALDPTGEAPPDGGLAPADAGAPGMQGPADPGGISFEARAFIGEYCALFEACCAVGGLTSRCAGRVGAAAVAGSFVASAAAECLAAVRQRQSSASFCAGLEIPSYLEIEASWAPVPECLSVFVPPGTTPPGGSCARDSDCAVGTNGSAFCFTSGTCVQTTGTAGDRCFGDFARAPLSREISLYPDSAPDVYLCDKDKQLGCDSTTRLCVEIQVQAVGGPCPTGSECDADSYCSTTGNTCAARLPPDAPCATSAECAGVCDPTTQRCADALPSGAACSGESGLCGSGLCLESRCSSTMPSVCGV